MNFVEKVTQECLKHPEIQSCNVQGSYLALYSKEQPLSEALWKEVAQAVTGSGFGYCYGAGQEENEDGERVYFVNGSLTTTGELVEQYTTPELIALRKKQQDAEERSRVEYLVLRQWLKERRAELEKEVEIAFQNTSEYKAHWQVYKDVHDVAVQLQNEWNGAAPKWLTSGETVEVRD